MAHVTSWRIPPGVTSPLAATPPITQARRWLKAYSTGNKGVSDACNIGGHGSGAVWGLPIITSLTGGMGLQSWITRQEMTMRPGRHVTSPRHLREVRLVVAPYRRPSGRAVLIPAWVGARK
jgi:hypothetical protein